VNPCRAAPVQPRTRARPRRPRPGGGQARSAGRARHGRARRGTSGGGADSRPGGTAIGSTGEVSRDPTPGPQPAPPTASASSSRTQPGSRRRQALNFCKDARRPCSTSMSTPNSSAAAWARGRDAGARIGLRHGCAPGEWPRCRRWQRPPLHQPRASGPPSACRRRPTQPGPAPCCLARPPPRAPTTPRRSCRAAGSSRGRRACGRPQPHARQPRQGGDPPGGSPAPQTTRQTRVGGAGVGCQGAGEGAPAQTVAQPPKDPQPTWQSPRVSPASMASSRRTPSAAAACGCIGKVAKGTESQPVGRGHAARGRRPSWAPVLAAAARPTWYLTVHVGDARARLRGVPPAWGVSAGGRRMSQRARRQRNGTAWRGRRRGTPRLRAATATAATSTRDVPPDRPT
jgi:hypothetical protein